MALTVKQEAFCCAYIENGGNASEAYRKSYSAGKMKPEVIHVKACELLKNGNVAVRIDALRADLQKRHELTVDDIIAELEEAREVAKSLLIPNTGSMVAATLGKAKVLGLIKDKTELTGLNGGPIGLNINVSFVSPK